MIPGMCELWSCLPAHNPFPKSGLAMPSDLHPPWAGTTLLVRGVPPCRQVAPQARAESQCEPGPTSWIFLFFLPLCNVAGEGKCQAERKTACAVPTVQGGEILDCSIVTSRCVTESTSSSSHAGEDQAYSHHYSASKIQASNPFISLTKDRKPPLRGSGGSLALSLCLSRCAGASRTWAP